jgi:predicted nucleic acid-binding protein
LIFPPKGQALVGDASFWISAVASGRSDEILRAIPNNVVITDVAYNELERGRARGRRTIEGVERLVAANLLSVVSCPAEAEPVYFDLVGGNAAETLDDGEACTLAYALHFSGCAVIDEKKATALAGRRFPALPLLSTADLMLSAEIRRAIGAEGAADALYEALTGARMRVPERLVNQVCTVLGEDRAKKCHSLPQRLRPARAEAKAPS